MLEIMTNETEAAARIIVIGVGGAGNNAVNRMVEEQIGGVEFIGVDSNEFNAADGFLHHSIYSIISCTTYTDYDNLCR